MFTPVKQFAATIAESAGEWPQQLFTQALRALAVYD
jgi:hypothetical protein